MGARRRPSIVIVVLSALGLVVPACASDAGVAVEESNRSEGDLVPDGQAGLPPVDRADPPAGDLPVVEAPESSLVWGDCAAFDIPSDPRTDTSGWECTTLAAQMDPFGAGAGGGGDEVELALTRHRATGERRGAILLNPGGPGGAGLPAAWAIRSSMPADVLRSFDIVSWDPRGIGQSMPNIDCGGGVDVGDVGYISGCVESTGRLSAFLSAPYSAADMEAIRSALGEGELNFLGYSYGSILGATYAAAHPDRVGAFVLDGVTDPAAGSPNGPFDGGFPVLADDGRPEALDRFEELCDATTHCLDGLDAETIVDDLAGQVPALSTDDFAGDPQRIDSDGYAGFVDSVITYSGDWELVATALSDADRGDASAMAAFIGGKSDPLLDGADDDTQDGPDGVTDFAEANFMIYCADLGPLLTGPTFCDEMPVNAEPLSPVRAVDLERPMLLIGTEFDPLTPGYHAADFAAALGDATHIIWEGVGHTAFPGWTPCVDDAVAAQFLRRPVPADGTRCSFLEGVDDDATLADELFAHGDLESDGMLRRAIEGRRLALDGSCLATAVNEFGDQVISHVILGVTSEQATDALDAADATC